MPRQHNCHLDFILVFYLEFSSNIYILFKLLKIIFNSYIQQQLHCPKPFTLYFTDAYFYI